MAQRSRCGRDAVRKAGTPADGNIVHWSAAAPPKNGELYTDADWNEASTIDTEPYPLSKTLAEKAAWDFAKKENFDLVTINPVRTCRRHVCSRVARAIAAPPAIWMYSCSGKERRNEPVCVCLQVFVIGPVISARTDATSIKLLKVSRIIVDCSTYSTHLRLNCISPHLLPTDPTSDAMDAPKFVSCKGPSPCVKAYSSKCDNVLWSSGRAGA